MGSVNVSVRPRPFILISVARCLVGSRRQNALGCKPRISRAVSRAVTNFMRMSDATPPGPQTSACSTSLPRVLTREELEERLGKGRKPGDDELLGDDPANIIDALKAAILAGAVPSDLGRSLTYGAALRVARFGNANEHADWEAAHHVFTYANALDQLIKRIGSDSDSDITVVRRVLHGAMELYLTRYLNVPPARSACSTITGPYCANATIVQQDRPYVPLRGL